MEHFIPQYTVLPIVAALMDVTNGCSADEFECNYPADGCIPLKKVYDGEIDCFRDGSDENEFQRTKFAKEKFPNGKNSLFFTNMTF